MPSVTLRAPTEQAPAATPPRRATAVVATEGRDWTWTFEPPVPEALRPRLAELAAEMADCTGLLAELRAQPVWAWTLEEDLSAQRQEQLLALAFDAAAALGYRLAVRPACGRPRERGGDA